MPATRLIGLLGGTFDPVHLGHLEPARAVRERLELDELRLVPCRQPAHRGAPVADATQRLAMLRLAQQTYPELALETAELERPGPSYAVDTLAVLGEREPDTVWCWVLGVDAFQAFYFWHRWDRILELAHLVVMTRPGYQLTGKARELRENNAIKSGNRAALCERGSGGVLLLDVDSPDVSSTQVRRRLAEGHSPAGLVPPAVADYLNNHAVYPPLSISS